MTALQPPSARPPLECPPVGQESGSMITRVGGTLLYRAIIGLAIVGAVTAWTSMTRDSPEYQECLKAFRIAAVQAGYDYKVVEEMSLNDPGCARLK